MGADVLADGQRRPRPGGAERRRTRLIVSRLSPGVLANGGGSCSTGVRLAQRLREVDDADGAVRERGGEVVRVSVATKCLL